jgi:hypothetical protein
MQTISATQHIYPKPRQITRCTGGKKRQADACSAQRTADDFLNHRFLPLYAPEADMPPAQEVETDYFSSLKILTDLQHIAPMDVSGKPYPYNILLSHWDSKRKLNRQPIDTGLHIIYDDHDRVRLATKQEFEPGHTLYYIPVMPLFRFMRVRERKACAELLLSVMAYLYHEVRVPYYRDEGSYLYYHYECNKDWLMECAGDYDLEEYDENMCDIWQAEYCGDEMERKIYNRYQLEHFEERLNRFKPKDALEREALRVAADAWLLWHDHPAATVFRFVRETDPDDDNEYDIASFEAYVSFVGDCKGWLYENIERGISDELNEYAETALPCRVQVFDDPQAGPATGLEFEYRLFDLILNLATILQDLP